MNLAQQVLAVNDNLPIKTDKPVHSGKVRSVYWLTKDDSARLIAEKKYNVAPDAPLAIMVISDRISAFDCIWHGEENLKGIPGKGAALNAISNHWFKCFKDNNLANSHIVDIPHPLVWIVQKAQPIKIEAICRQYITGSMWRSYSKGERDFCGIKLANNLTENQRLSKLLITPSTKGILKNIPNVPAVDDVNISNSDIINNLTAFGFKKEADVTLYQKLLKDGFNLISNELAKVNQIFVDTKFEFGYVKNKKGENELIYMDEVGTPDSSRMWDSTAFKQGSIVENSKEGFRQFLLNYFPEPEILLDKSKMAAREQLAKDTELPLDAMLALSKVYLDLAEKITGAKINLSADPYAEIVSILDKEYSLIK